MLMRLLNWLRGYLLVQISGNSPERFINLCSNKKLRVWNLKRVDDNFQFNISIKSYRKIKPIVRKTGLVPKIIKKIGLPFYLHRYRKRKGFFIGIIICTILIYIMTLFIWDINIQGGYKYTPEALLKFLKKNNIYTGIKKSSVDCQEIEETIRLAYNDIGWVSAEIKGTRLNIKITETNMPAPKVKAIAPSHIAATKDSIIQSIITSSGTPKVKAGDVVKKGDILVSGLLYIKDDSGEIIDIKKTIAEAIIRCKSYYDYYDEFPMEYIKKIFSGKSVKGYYIMFLGKKIFLYNPGYSYDKYDIIVNENAFHITDTFFLPFRYGTVTAREYIDQNMIYSEEEAATIAKERLKRYFDLLIKNDVLITENNVTIIIENNTCIAKGRILVEEPAWEYIPIDESEWRIEPADEHSGDNH